MKNNKFLLIILLVLAAVAVYYYVTNSSGTIKNELKDFAIKDTASIDKIFISDSKGEKVTLTRTENYWVVDGNYKARPECISVLMTTFSQIAVKAPVAKVAFNNVVREIATNTTKVEIYLGKDKPAKVYYIGGPTQNSQGTYMVLENDGVKSSVPFITYIPGFNGYLTTRFFANPLQWKDAAIFKYLPQEIKSIDVTYFDKPEESFNIQQNMNNLSFIDGVTLSPIKNFDTSKVKQYLRFFDKIYYEMTVLDELKPDKKDSVMAEPPIFSIEVKDIFGKSNKIVALHMKNYKNKLDDKGEPYPYDLDRMYGILNNNLLVYIQFYTFDKITVPKQFFLSER